MHINNAPKRNFLETLKIFFEPIKHYKKSYFILTAQVAAWPLWGIVTTLMLSRAVNYIQANNSAAFFRVILYYLLFIVVYQVYNLILRNISAKLPWTLYGYLRNQYLYKFIKLDSNATEGVGTGRMLSIIDKGIDTWVTLLMQMTWKISDTIIQLLFVTYILAQIARYIPLLFCVFLVLMLLCVGVVVRNGNKYRSIRNDLQDEMGRQNVKAIMSKFEILMNNKVERENQNLMGLVEQTKVVELKKNFYDHVGFNIPSVAIALTTIGLFSFLGYQYFYFGTISYAAVILYVGIANSLNSGTRSAIDFYQIYIKNFQRITKLWNTFSSIPSVKGYDKGKEFAIKNGTIQFDDVCFGYGSENVLEGFSCTLQGGTKTAFVGVSGGGKSTIIKLIAGYLHATKGTISIDGQFLPAAVENKNAIALKTYFSHIGYLTQEPNVFDGTIYDNLLYALDEKPTAEEVTYAIEQAQCQFIYDFKDGLLTEIGEKGIRLSGGQRQRLAIAKIFLKNPKIVLLDEPTSALDSLSEEAITKAMHNLFEGRTVIIIAHRLQTVKQADDIIVLEQGKIIERGTHKELVELGGHYAKMLELQSGF